jgi:hypothetical protein
MDDDDGSRFVRDSGSPTIWLLIAIQVFILACTTSALVAGPQGNGTVQWTSLEEALVDQRHFQEILVGRPLSRSGYAGSKWY